MLKRVPKDQIRAGMWVDSIEGWWFLHPFWSADFLISAEDSETFRASRIKGIVIDTEKGADLTPPPAATPAVPAPRTPAQMCQTAFKRDPRSASKRDPFSDMMLVC
jgi:hypothetical protein